MLKRDKNTIPPLHFILLMGFGAAFLWSAVNPRDPFTWVLEVIPAVLGIGAVAASYKNFRLTNLLYVLIFFHALILLVGGHYTYAEMPIFNWLKDIFGLSRNYYDRLGHFFQGFVPALIAREILLRKTDIKRGWILNVLVVCIPMAVSAVYEILEWLVAEATGSAAQAFLGTQGDVWDTQWDMFMALLGAIGSFLWNKIHDRQLQFLGKPY